MPERGEIRPKPRAKRRPVVESSIQRAGVPLIVPKRGLFGYHQDRVWELSGECRFIAVGLILVGISGCVSNGNTLALGALGAAGGGYAGSYFGKGQGQLLAAGGGTVLGGLIGAFVGNKFDGVSRNEAAISDLYSRQEQLSQRSNNQTFIYPNAPQSGVNPHCQLRNNYYICNSH